MTWTDTLWFSPVGFAIALVTVGVGTAAGLAAVPVVGAFLGTLIGAFVVGLAVEERPLLETGVAAILARLGVLATATSIGNDLLAAVVALGSISPDTLLLSAALSFAVGVFGAHLGDDLRDGLTDPVEESPTRPTGIEATGSRPATTASVAEEQSESGEDEPTTSNSGDVELEGPE